MSLSKELDSSSQFLISLPIKANNWYVTQFYNSHHYVPASDFTAYC